jgi:hypothetical protein
MRVLVAIAAVSALDAFLGKPQNVTFERNLPSQGTFLEKSHETIQHVRTDLKELFKTVGELRSADLDEVSRQRSNFVTKLHSQEEEVRHQQAQNDKLSSDNKAILGAIDQLEHQKKDLLNENAQLEKRLKDLKGQVEQEVSGLETLLGSAPREASVLETEMGMGKTDEESADDAEDKDDDSKDDSKDDDSADDKDDDSADDKDDKADDKDDDKADDKDDDSADDKDDDSDDKEDSKASLAKTDSKAKDSKSDAKADAKADDKADDKDDDADDDKDDSDDADDETPEDGAVTADVQVSVDADESCRCVTACNKAQKPICFVNSASCKLKANCDKGAKGTACIKQDPVKGPWTFCSNVLNNATVAPKEEKENLLPENPNVAVALRMLADVKREILGVTQEDGEGARKLRESYRDEKATEEHKRKEVLDQQRDLEDAQEDDLARKQKLTDEVHALQDRNKSLRRQVDRIGEFLKSESSKLSDAVTVAKA